MSIIRLTQEAEKELIKTKLTEAKNKFNIPGEIELVPNNPDYIVQFNPYWPIFGITEITTNREIIHGFFSDKSVIHKVYNTKIEVKIANFEGGLTVVSFAKEYDAAALWIADQLAPYDRVKVYVHTPNAAANPKPKPPEIIVNENSKVDALVNSL